MTTKQLITEVKAQGEDFEFYPTTDAIIDALIADMKPTYCGYNRPSSASALDIGAGNGKVLLAMRAAEVVNGLHAIEKSTVLCQALHEDILIVGTDFAEQSLFSKQVDVIFSNPPYSQFEQWAEKIIRQAAASHVYLVIPQRWERSIAIADALKFRNVEAKIIGKFDFEDAEDRQARAVVHLLCIDFRREVYGHRYETDKDDAFERFFNEQFADLINKFKAPEEPKEGEEGDEPAMPKGGRQRPFSQLVVGPTYPEALVGLYNGEMAHVQRNYQLVSELDADLLREFAISPAKIMECLRTRLSGLRNDYWRELFAHLNSITDRLTSGSRKSLLETLHKHVQVDFTLSNIYAIIIWVIKNANRYLDSQLLETYDLMVDKANVVLYKSNKRTFEEERWRYRDEPSKNSHYALDYRIVTHRIGGIRRGYSFERGLDERACNFLGDLLTIARNLGFKCDTVHDCLGRGREGWISGKTRSFYFKNKAGVTEILFDVRAFLNGNLHIRLNKAFILALNVEHGRLKGWLRNAAEAVEELRDPEAAQFFKMNLQLPMGDPGLMLTYEPQASGAPAPSEGDADDADDADEATEADSCHTVTLDSRESNDSPSPAIQPETEASTMNHFNPLTGRTESAQPVAPDTAKPKRKAKAKAQPEAPAAAPATVATVAPIAAAPALSNAALKQAAERIPLAMYGALLVSTDRDAISTKAAFAAYCGTSPARDWRQAWKAFEAAGYPCAEAAPDDAPVIEGWIEDPRPAATVEADEPRNIVPFIQPQPEAQTDDSLADLLSSLR